MNKKTKVYCAVFPINEIEIPEEEKKIYLTCKFFKASKEEAILMANFYLGPVPASESLHRVIGILSGDFISENDINKKFDEINEAVQQGYFSGSSDNVKNKKYGRIISAIKAGNGDYPKSSTLIDIVEWARDCELIDPTMESSLKKTIKKVQGSVFKGSADNKLKLSLIGQFLSRPCNYIFYNDARELLFPELNLLPELKLAMEKGELVDGYSSCDGEVYYLKFKPLLKWLMQKGFIPQWMEEAFEEVKIESIKENLVDYKESFHSLHRLIQDGKDRNDLLSAGLNGSNIIYLKYPRDCLHWRQYYTTFQSGKIHSEVAAQRYNGLGQLKKRKTDDSHRCQFGGVTVDMLLYNEFPKHELSKSMPRIDYEIELVPTEEEARYGLQPYLKFPAIELSSIIADNNLIILHEDASLLGNDSSSRKSESTPSLLKQALEHDQLLTRASIMSGYLDGNKELTPKKWRYIFDNEKKNGLDKAARKGSERNKAIYLMTGLHSWLLKEGYFTQKQINKISHCDDRFNQFGQDMINLASPDS